MNCTRESIQRIDLHELRGRTVVIDCFQFLYKFMADNRMAEHMDQMIHMLLDRQIVPIFVFDGKPPIEKKAVLEQRRAKKQDAKTRYEELIQNLTTTPTPELANELACLKKKFIRIDYEHIQCAKKLMQQYEVEYVDAPGEADAVCVEMVQSHRAWACLSDDMDMFAYGCDRVLRELSLVTGKVTLYRTQSILIDLRLTMQEFREILVISGTDYRDDSTNDKQHNLYETMKWFQAYRNDTLPRETMETRETKGVNHRQFCGGDRINPTHSLRQKYPTRHYEHSMDTDTWAGYRTKYDRRLKFRLKGRSDTTWGIPHHIPQVVDRRNMGEDYYSSTSSASASTSALTFYPWLMKHTKYIRDYDQLMKIYHMFVLS